MTFLPIVARELGVAARKRSTFRLRMGAAVAALIVGGVVFTLAPLGSLRPAPSGSPGGVLFGALTWLLLGAALSAGLFLTADCLSEEKREGTLGFLFLTDLCGYDVVLGKLAAMSLRSIDALLAVFPVLAITLVMGGVTHAHFWKTALALFNALFCSLGAGMLVSALSRDAQRAMTGTLLLLAVMVAAGPVADHVAGATGSRGFIPRFSLASPGYVFTTAGDWGRSPFWRALCTTQVMGWLFLVLASVVVPRTWQGKTAAADATVLRTGHAYRWKYGDQKARAALRQKLIERNPVLWLACRERRRSLAVWIMALLVVMMFAFASVTGSSAPAWMVWASVSWVFIVAFYLSTASQACRFFVEARRSGLLELLLAAPLSAEAIVQGQWRALVRMFCAPVLVLLGVQAVVGLGSQAFWGSMPIRPGVALPSTALTLLTHLGGALTTLANLVALSWFGMWMGLTSKNTSLATLKTIAIVQIIPGFVISVGAGLAMSMFMLPGLLQRSAGGVNTLASWFPLVGAGVGLALALAKDFGFIWWARQRLYSAFREQAARAVGPHASAPPPARQPRIPAPPVLTAHPGTQ